LPILVDNHLSAFAISYIGPGILFLRFKTSSMKLRFFVFESLKERLIGFILFVYVPASGSVDFLSAMKRGTFERVYLGDLFEILSRSIGL